MFFAIFFYVGMIVIMGGLMALYVAFGFTGFWIGIGAVFLVYIWTQRRAPYSLMPEPMSGWFADDRPHLAPPVEHAKLGRASTALTNRLESSALVAGQHRRDS